MPLIASLLISATCKCPEICFPIIMPIIFQLLKIRCLTSTERYLIRILSQWVGDILFQIWEKLGNKYYKLPNLKIFMGKKCIFFAFLLKHMCKIREEILVSKIIIRLNIVLVKYLPVLIS